MRSCVSHSVVGTRRRLAPGTYLVDTAPCIVSERLCSLEEPAIPGAWTRIRKGRGLMPVRLQDSVPPALMHRGAAISQCVGSILLYFRRRAGSLRRGSRCRCECGISGPARPQDPYTKLSVQ